MDIYILMGQSNMAGRGILTEPSRTISNSSVKVFTGDMQWKIAQHPLHFDKPGITGVGPGLSFGIKMAGLNPNGVIGLVPTAVGGTSINSWIPGGKDASTGKYPFDDAVKRIQEAMKYGTVKGILWHQGESDSSPKDVEGYLSKLEILISRIRKIVGDENLPFVAGELGQFKEQFRRFNTEIKSLKERVAQTAVVSSDGLSDKGDQTHFDTRSALELGNRYAEEMVKLQKKK